YVPVIRGLLAEHTGNEDSPYKQVILQPTEEVKKGCLQLKNEVDYCDNLKKNTKKLKKVLEKYREMHGKNPEMLEFDSEMRFFVRSATPKEELPLANKVALVTGAAGAIGYGICRGLMEKGCHVAASDLAGERLDELVGELGKISADRVMGFDIDVTDEVAVKEGIRRIVKTWGGIDILVINAGIAHVSFIKDMELEKFRQLEQVNVEGTLLALRECGNLFADQGTGGDIIIISTKNVPAPGAGFGAYSATKAGCHQLGRLASLEMAQYGVRVNMVAPDAVFGEGKFKSGLWQEVGPDRMKARDLDEEGLQEYYRQRNLLKVRVTGRHVANAVLFFATRQTPTTGATIPVDGGLPEATMR
ncbi:MAG: SDR family NAD(P)-dependent oxidoreductase, partial [Planctomycetes bacterium]|nr:SDR family NAD(P)-dependent oxidoreductase [Planctomycetota bacterium]